MFRYTEDTFKTKIIIILCFYNDLGESKTSKQLIRTFERFFSLYVTRFSNLMNEIFVCKIWTSSIFVLEVYIKMLEFQMNRKQKFNNKYVSKRNNNLFTIFPVVNFTKYVSLSDFRRSISLQFRFIFLSSIR